MDGQPNLVIEQLLELQTIAWQNGNPCRIERLLESHCLSTAGCNPDDLLSLVCNEVRLRKCQSEVPTLEEYQLRFPSFVEQLATQWAINEFFDVSHSTDPNEQETIAHRAGDASDNSPTSTLPSSNLAADSSESQFVGRYEILREVGRGAMGIVYEAYDPQLRRTVAIKRLKAGADSGLGEKHRFAVEAKSIAQLKHPAVVPVYDIGEANGLPFIAMEYCEGGTLSKRLQGSPLNPNEAARLLVQVTEGVAAAHALKIIHRDLKPGNILLVDKTSLKAKVTDFGLAKWLDQDITDTGSGALLGSPAYMPPEQVYGNSDAITPGADIYSLGAILYECLTGGPPFRGATVADTLQQVRSREPVRIRQLVNNVPIDLETIALKCLNKNPLHRYLSADALKLDLERFLAGRPIEARRPGWFELSVKWCNRNRSVAALLATIALLVSVSLIGLSSVLVRLKQEYDDKLGALADRTAALAEKAEALAQRDIANKELEIGRDLAERRLYNSQITLAQRALEAQEFARCEDLLQSIVPQEGQPDNRGFEWQWLKNNLHRNLLAEVKAGEGEVMALAYVGDGNSIVAVGGGELKGYVCLMSVNDGQVRMQKDFSATVNACAGDPTSSRFAIGTGDGDLLVYDAKTLELLHQSHTGYYFKSMYWSPDGRLIAAGTEQGELCLWTTGDWELLQVLVAEPMSPVLRVFFSRDGKRLYTSTDWGSRGRHSQQWLLSGDKLTAGVDFAGMSLSDEAVDATMVVGSNWGTLVLADGAKGEVQRSTRVSGGPLLSVSFSDDGEQLIVASRNDRELRVLSMTDFTKTFGLASRDTLSSVAMQHGTQRIATGDASGAVRIWNLQGGREHRRTLASESAFSIARFRSDSCDVLVGRDGRVLKWDPLADNLQELQAVTALKDAAPASGLSADPQAAGSVADELVGDLRAFSADGSTRVYLRPSSTDGSRISVFRPGDVEPHVIELNYKIYEDCLELSAAGHYLATRGEGGMLEVFDLHSDSHEPLYRLDAPCLSLAFSHSEELLACGTQYGRVRLFQLSDGARQPDLADFRGFWAWGMGAAFSRDDRYLAVGTEAGKVQVWRMQDRALIAELTGNREEVRRIDFFPDGRRLVCDGAGIIRVWDFVAGQELLTLPLPEFDVKHVEVSANEKQLLAITSSGRTFCWTAD